MGSGKGGSSDSSGMYAALASAQAADQAYQLGEQQFQWSKDVWTQEQPLYDAAQQAQIDLATQQTASLTQMQNEAAQQWQDYLSTYQPLEQQYVGQAQNWASPQAIAQARGEAMGSVASQGQAGLNAAAETLRGYGVNPSSGKYASLYTSAQPMLGAAEAAAGTTAAQNLRLQQMGLEAGAINTGRGMVNTTGSLTQAGTGAGAAGSSSAGGAANTASQNLSGTAVGAGATSNLFNAGTGAMNSYVSAVNGYNQTQADFAAANAQEMAGFGQAAGTVLGMFMPKIAKGGEVQRYADGGAIGYSNPQLTPSQGGGMTGIPGSPLMPAQLPPGQTVPPTRDGSTGGSVFSHMSASGGKITDDVPAQLNVGEYVVDKAAAQWIGHKQLAKLVDKARQERHQYDQRDDVGGEPTMAIPQRPTFVSRAMGGAIPGMG